MQITGRWPSMDDDEIFDDLGLPCPFVTASAVDGQGQVVQDTCREEADHIDIRDGRWYCSDHGALEEVAW